MGNHWNSGRATAVGYGTDDTSRTPGTYDLSTVFALGTSGRGVAFCVPAPATTTVTKIHFRITACSGTPTPGTHDITVRLCSQASSGTARPGTSLGSVNAGVSATACWKHVTFASPIAITKGTLYWITVGQETAADVYHTIQTRGCGVGVYPVQSIQGYTESTGFATACTAVTPQLGMCVVEFGNGEVMGNAYSSGFNDSETLTDKLYERGILISGLNENVKVRGVAVTGGSTSMYSIKVYHSSESPGGAILSGFNGGAALIPDASGLARGFILFPTDVELSRGESYRIVYDPNATCSRPQYVSVEDLPGAGSDFDALKAVCGGWGMFYTVEIYGTGWRNYDNVTDGLRTPNMSIVLADLSIVPSVSNVFVRTKRRYI